MFGILVRLLLAITGMVLVEQLYRNLHPQQRWGLKFLCLGLGGMFACDFYLYSDALLFRQVNNDIWATKWSRWSFRSSPWQPLANPKWSLDIFVSRRILFHSTAMLSRGVLLVMAAAGYHPLFWRHGEQCCG
jgi:hypothetical protein